MGAFGDDEEGESFQRKNRFTFVLPRLQMKFILLIFLSSIGIILFSYLVMNYLLTHQVQDLIENTTLSAADIAKISHTLNISIGYWGLICVLFSIMMMSFSFFHTHQVAGPVYHITRVLNEYFDGRVNSRIHLRKGDEFIILEDLINRLIDELEKNKKNAITKTDINKIS